MRRLTTYIGSPFGDVIGSDRNQITPRDIAGCNRRHGYFLPVQTCQPSVFIAAWMQRVLDGPSTPARLPGVLVQSVRNRASSSQTTPPGSRARRPITNGFEHVLANVERASAWYAIRYARHLAIWRSHISMMVSNLAHLPYILPNSYVMPAIHE